MQLFPKTVLKIYKQQTEIRSWDIICKIPLLTLTPKPNPTKVSHCKALYLRTTITVGNLFSSVYSLWLFAGHFSNHWFKNMHLIWRQEAWWLQKWWLNCAVGTGPGCRVSRECINPLRCCDLRGWFNSKQHAAPLRTVEEMSKQLGKEEKG